MCVRFGVSDRSAGLWPGSQPHPPLTPARQGDHRGPPRRHCVLHEAPGERAEGQGGLPRRLGLDRAPHLRQPHARLPPGDGQLRPVPCLPLSGAHRTPDWLLPTPPALTEQLPGASNLPFFSPLPAHSRPSSSPCSQIPGRGAQPRAPASPGRRPLRKWPSRCPPTPAGGCPSPTPQGTAPRGTPPPPPASVVWAHRPCKPAETLLS